MFDKKWVGALAVATVVLGGTGQSQATIFFYDDTPYYSTGDIPSGFYAGGSPTFLEDFEDGTLGGQIIEVFGSLQTSPWIDSVDFDDGSLNGSGSDGKSWVVSDSATFTFRGTTLPTAFALVLTDANPDYGNTGRTTSDMRFEAFGLGEVSLGTFDVLGFGDNEFEGKTLEDRFFGVTDPNGILGIKMTNISGTTFEVDHVQYGQEGSSVVPEPSALAIFTGLFGMGLIGYWRRRRRSER